VLGVEPNLSPVCLLNMCRSKKNGRAAIRKTAAATGFDGHHRPQLRQLHIQCVQNAFASGGCAGALEVQQFASTTPTEFRSIILDPAPNRNVIYMDFALP
jgi:hypothetical protein